MLKFNHDKFFSKLLENQDLSDAMSVVAIENGWRYIYQTHMRQKFKWFTPREDCVDETLFHATNLEMADFYIDSRKLYPLTYIEALSALENGQFVECNLDSVLDGYDKYTLFYLGVTQFGSICWVWKATGEIKMALMLSKEVRSAKFKIYEPLQEKSE